MVVRSELCVRCHYRGRQEAVRSALEKTPWAEPGPVIDPGMNVGHPGHVGQPLRTRDGTIIIVYNNYEQCLS